MTQPSTVMALVPAYEAADFIQATLDSLSAQTYPHLTVLISVDVCNDDTHEICLAHSRRDARFRVVQQQGERLGYSGNCNFLIAQADADYAMLAFHDDVLEPTFTEKLSRVLDERAGAVLAFPDMHLTNVDGSEEHFKFTALEGLKTPRQRGLVMAGQPLFWAVPNRGLFRVAQARSVGGIKPHRAGEFSVDYPWLFHLSLLGEFTRVPQVLVHKRYQRRSLSRSWEYNATQCFELIASCLRELWNADISTEDKIALSELLREQLLVWQAKLAGKRFGPFLAKRALRRLRRWLNPTA